MSKYSKHLKDKEYRKMTKEINRKSSRKFLKSSDIDNRSTINTFQEWCDECTKGQLFFVADVLSILGSDGPDVTCDKLDTVPFNQPVAIDAFLEEEGYYESCDVLLGKEHYNAPKVHYLEWFNKKFNTNYQK